MEGRALVRFIWNVIENKAIISEGTQTSGKDRRQGCACSGIWGYHAVIWPFDLTLRFTRHLSYVHHARLRQLGLAYIIVRTTRGSVECLNNKHVESRDLLGFV